MGEQIYTKCHRALSRAFSDEDCRLAGTKSVSPIRKGNIPSLHNASPPYDLTLSSVEKTSLSRDFVEVKVNYDWLS